MPSSRGLRLAKARGARAVALRYLPELPAPFIVAKGEGGAAERLLELASEHGVPVVREGGLADLLFAEDVGAFIPVEYYGIVAKLFAFVAGLRSGGPEPAEIDEAASPRGRRAIGEP